MKLSDAIKYSYTKTIRDKKNIYFVVVLTLCLFILIASLFFRIVYFSLCADFVEMSKESRQLFVISKNLDKYWDDKNYDLGYDKLLESEQIIDVYDSNYSLKYITSETFKDEKHDGGILFAYGSEASLPKYINGERIKDDDTGVAVCSKNFYPNTTDGMIKNEDIQVIDANKLIGSTFKIETQKYVKVGNGFTPSGTYAKEYKIIGTFDASETRDDLNTCYISKNDIKELVDVTDTNNYDYSVSSYVALVDKFSNIKNATKDIEKMGFKVQVSPSADYETLNVVKAVCIIIISIIIIAIIFLSSLYVKKHNVKNKNEMAIMKSYGYEKKDIMRFSLGSLSCLMLISFSIGITLFLSTLTILKFVFHNFLLVNHIYIGFFISPYVATIIILMIIIIITNYFTINRLSKRQTLSIIKE